MSFLDDCFKEMEKQRHVMDISPYFAVEFVINRLKNKINKIKISYQELHRVTGYNYKNEIDVIDEIINFLNKNEVNEN